MKGKLTAGKMQKVTIISSGQPALNPRLVKEADALSDSGYEVTVIYAYWNHWGYDYTRQLLSSKKWKAVYAGGDPIEKPFPYLLSRLIHHAAKKLIRYTGPIAYFSELAISRSSYFLTREAKRNGADLYIGHNLGALAPAVKAAKKHHAKCGFDAEDFHRNELTDDENDPRVKLVVHLEQKYIPQLDYLTASSPQIADAYARLFNRKVTTLLNVFPAKKNFRPVINRNGNLKLFWFSQTIGPNRGLETIIEAINIANIPIELHLLGFHPDTSYNNSLSKLANYAGQTCFLYFHDPVPPDSIFHIARLFDIGLAAEPGFCLNNKIALSNKLFTYLQSGLAVVASNTTAQKAFFMRYPDIGEIYCTTKGLADILVAFHKDRALLYQSKKHNMKTGRKLLSWETEQGKFLRLLRETLDTSTASFQLKKKLKQQA